MEHSSSLQFYKLTTPGYWSLLQRLFQSRGILLGSDTALRFAGVQASFSAGVMVLDDIVQHHLPRSLNWTHL